jgi:hypothetical protein
MVMGYADIIGLPMTFVRIPLWAVGSSRKSKADFAFQKFNILANPMAVGLGIKVRF